MATDRSQPWPGRQVARVAVDGAPDVGGVGQHAAHGGGVPSRPTPAALAPSLLQATADLAQAEPIQADPGEDEPHQPRFLPDHVEARRPPALILWHLAGAPTGG